MAIIDWIFSNMYWIFSGIGVALIGFLFSILFKKRILNRTDIKTKGPFSPGIVNGDFNVDTKR